MPLPVIAGIPFVAGLLGGLFGSLLSFLAKFFTKKVALVFAAILIFTSLTSALFLALKLLVASVAVVTPDFVITAASLVIPDNAILCITVIVNAKLLRFAYDWNVKIVQLKLF